MQYYSSLGHKRDLNSSNLFRKMLYRRLFSESYILQNDFLKLPDTSSPNETISQLQNIIHIYVNRYSCYIH